MSFQALKWARTQMPRGAKGKPSGIAKAVLFQLCDMADDKGYCWPGQGTLSRLTGFGVTSVSAALVILENEGYLARTAQRHRSGARRGQRTSDFYKLQLGRPPDNLVRGVTQPASLKSAALRKHQERVASSGDRPPSRDCGYRA